MLTGICPNCEKVRSLEFIQRKDVIEVKAKLIDVDDQFLRCLECNHDFDDPKSDFDVLAVAYQKYHDLYDQKNEDDKP